MSGAGTLAFMRENYDAAIVGGGAAGLSAALVLGRSCRSVVLFDDGRPRNSVADRMHGFLSREGTPPGELLAIARSQLQQYHSVELVEGHVSAAERGDDRFVVQTAEGQRCTVRKIVLATGVYDELPAIEGLQEQWGRTVFVCPYCDGWEMRSKRIAVAGKGDKAVELAQELWQWTDDLAVCFQGEREGLNDLHERWLRAVKPAQHEAAIVRLAQNGRLEIAFSDGTNEACDALFMSAPLRPRYPLVEMLGCTLKSDGQIETDDRGRTGIRGVYAAGDVVTSVHQVTLAAASGACAAMAVNEDLLEEEVRRVSRAID